MKFITVIAEQVSPQTLATALPPEGVTSVTVAETQSFSRDRAAVEYYRGRRIARHFATVYRIDLVVEDDHVNQVIDGIAFVRGAGLLGDAQAWVSAGSADELFADGLFAADRGGAAVA